MRFFSVFVLFFICFAVAAATRTLASSSSHDDDSALIESENVDQSEEAFTDRAFVEHMVDADIEAATDAQIDAELEADAQAEAEMEAEAEAEAEVDAEAEVEAEAEAEAQVQIIPAHVPGSYNFTFAKDIMKLNAINDCGAAKVNAWDCKLCAFASTAGFHTRTTFENPKKNTFGYVGVMPTQDKKAVIVVSFRGTEKTSMKNWLTNLNFGKDPFPGLATSIQVHQGFLGAYLDVQSQVLNAITKAQKACQDCRILLTGHSLGGALATIAAADLAVRKIGVDKLSLYTYGSPRVGNDAFATWFNTQVKDSFRVTHADDAVIHVPFDNMGFTHIGLNVHYPKPFVFNTNLDNQRFCGLGESNKSCQSKGIGFNIFKIGSAVSQHLKYLDVDCGCGDDNLAAFRFKQNKNLQNEFVLVIAQLAGIDTKDLSLQQVKEKLAQLNCH